MFLDRAEQLFLLYFIKLLGGFLKGNNDILAEKSLRGLVDNPDTGLFLDIVDQDGAVIQSHLCEGGGFLIRMSRELLVLIPLVSSGSSCRLGVPSIAINIIRSFIILLRVKLRSDQWDANTHNSLQRQIGN
jgi:hypothetical protein